LFADTLLGAYAAMRIDDYFHKKTQNNTIDV
jgi:hypothetical protein